MDEYECEGEGSCLKECECSYLKGTNDCSCYFEYNHSHLKTETKRFCVKPCKYRCVLKDCKTFNYCQESYPEWYYSDNLLTTNINGDQCNTCGIFKVKFPDEIGNCYFCYEDKYLIETYCNHRFCLDCLIDMNAISDSEEYDEKGNKIKRNPSSCSFCRQNIEFTTID